jgi:phasin family protein
MSASLKAAPGATAAVAAKTEDTAARTFDRTVAGLKDGVNTATSGLEQAQASVKESMDKAMRTAEEMVSFGQGNVEAALRSGQILATGMQDLAKQAMSTAQARLGETLSGVRAMSSIRSPKEAFDLQANLFSATLGTAFTETGKLFEASWKLAEQAWAPLTERATLAAERFGRTA